MIHFLLHYNNIMLSIVCTINNDYEVNIDKWLDYYFTIGIRYIFFMGSNNPSNKMIHIFSKKTFGTKK